MGDGHASYSSKYLDSLFLWKPIHVIRVQTKKSKESSLKLKACNDVDHKERVWIRERGKLFSPTQSFGGSQFFFSLHLDFYDPAPTEYFWMCASSSPFFFLRKQNPLCAEFNGIQRLTLTVRTALLPGWPEVDDNDRWLDGGKKPFSRIGWLHRCELLLSITVTAEKDFRQKRVYWKMSGAVSAVCHRWDERDYRRSRPFVRRWGRLRRIQTTPPFDWV